MERVEVKEQVLEADRPVEVGGVGERGEAGMGFGARGRAAQEAFLGSPRVPVRRYRGPMVSAVRRLLDELSWEGTLAGTTTVASA